MLAVLAGLTACAHRPTSASNHRTIIFRNWKGGMSIYGPVAVHSFHDTVILTHREPVSKKLPDWRLASIDSYGFTRLRLTIPEASKNVISAYPGQEFPQFGNVHLRLSEASAAEGFAKIKVSTDPL